MINNNNSEQKTQAHNLKVGGSNPPPATNIKQVKPSIMRRLSRRLHSAILRFFVPFFAKTSHNLDTIKRFAGWVLLINVAQPVTMLMWIPHLLEIQPSHWFLGVFIISPPIAWLIVTEHI